MKMNMKIIGVGTFGSRIVNRVSQQYPTLKSNCISINDTSLSTIGEIIKHINLTVITGCSATGIKISQYILNNITNQNRINFIFQYPFEFEGTNRRQIAGDITKLVKDKPNVKLSRINADRFLKYYDPKIKMKSVIDKLDDEIINRILECCKRRLI